MAHLDLFSLLVMLPQTVLFELDLMPESVYITEGGISVVCYLFVQVAMVIDRVFAVFTPFKNIRNRDRFNLVLFVIIAIYIPIMICVQSILLFVTNNERVAKIIVDIVLFVIGLTTLSIIFAAYPAIALKLFRQKRKIHASTMTNTEQNDANKPMEAHIKALRLCGGVLALFILSFVPNTFLSVTGIRSLNYFYYFNHVGNPVVYYIFNEKFRNDFF